MIFGNTAEEIDSIIPTLIIMDKLTFVVVTVLQIVHINGFTIQPKIINGVLSNPADYPFFVDITSIWGYCDGVLINDK